MPTPSPLYGRIFPAQKAAQILLALFSGRKALCFAQTTEETMTLPVMTSGKVSNVFTRFGMYFITPLTLRYRLAINLFLETVSSLASSLERLYSFAY